MKEKKQNYRVDDSLSLEFTKYMEKYEYLYRNLANKTKQFLPKSEKETIIIDLSVGPGLLSFELNKQINKAQIIGIDPSISMVKIAQEKIKDNNNYNLIISRVENLPLISSYADIVVSRFGVSSWIDIDKGFSEIFRILKPDGKLILEILNNDFPKWKQLIMKIHMRINGAGKELIKYNIDSYKKILNVRQIEKTLNHIGFKIIERQGKQYDWKLLIIASKIQ